MIALRERNFRLYWFGQAVSNIGNWMQIVALGWFVLQINGSPLALGLLGLAQSLPIFALSLFGGIAADRFPRLKLLLVTQSAALLLAVVLALLASLGRPPLWSVLFVATLASIVTAIDNPARQAFLSDLVSKDVLLNAVSLNASVYNGAAIIGPSLAGLLLLRAGAELCFLLNAVSFLAVLVALVLIAVNKRHSTRAVSASNASNVKPAFYGFTSLCHESAILSVLLIATATSLLGRPYLLLMPAFARFVQHVGPPGLGIMIAASGLGSLLGSLVLASLKSFRHLEVLLAVCGIGFGLVLVIFALMQSFLLVSLVLVFCGAGATITMMVANTLLQTYAPAEMRGRVMSLYTLIAAGCTQLGTLIISSLAREINLEAATIVAGLGVGVVIIFAHRKLKAAKAQ